MPKVKFIGTTLTSKGRFEAGESADFTVAEAKDLQRLSTVEGGERSTVTDAEPKKKSKSKKLKASTSEETETEEKE